MMSKITVFTIVYNNYGHFIPQWIEWIKKQTYKPEILVVLGKDHGADTEWLKENGIKYVTCNSDNMGELRNAGLKKVRTEWWLYFSVDDELLPHACEEIINTDADAVSLTFDVIEPDGTIKKDCHSPCINTIEELNNWSRCWGGYVAIKGNTDIRFREDIEVPNLTLHFELFKRGLKTVRSEKSSAIHHRWSESHHFRSKNIRKSFVDEIEKTKKEIIEEIKKELKAMKYKVVANKEWKERKIHCNDFNPKIIPEEGQEWEVDGLRLKVLLGENSYNINFVKSYEPIEKQNKEIEKINEKEKEVKTKKKTTKKKVAKKQ